MKGCVWCDLHGWNEEGTRKTFNFKCTRCGGGGRARTFKIKLVDVFQRLVDKVETSESLRKDKNGRFSKSKQHN